MTEAFGTTLLLSVCCMCPTTEDDVDKSGATLEKCTKVERGGGALKLKEVTSCQKDWTL